MVTPERLAKLQAVGARRQEGVIVLEDIYDPHNAQAVFRTAEVFGFQRIALIFDKQKAFDPKRVGKLSSSSANKWLDFMIFTSKAFKVGQKVHLSEKPTESCLQDLKAKGYEIWATVRDPDCERSDQDREAHDAVVNLKADNIYNANLSARRIAIVFGNEHRGLSAEALRLADKLITIPQAGWVESFNLSVAAGIFIYEITRQRMALGMDNYILSEAERSQLLSDFEGR